MNTLEAQQRAARFAAMDAWEAAYERADRVDHRNPLRGAAIRADACEALAAVMGANGNPESAARWLARAARWRALSLRGA